MDERPFSGPPARRPDPAARALQPVSKTDAEEEPDGSITGGVECPECGAFISDEELDQQDDESEAA